MKYLVQVVGEQNGEYVHLEKRCADGVTRKLFECPRGYSDVKIAVAAISEYNLKIEVFEEEIEGIIIRFDLWKRAVRKRKIHANLRRGVGPASRRLKDKIKGKTKAS